MSARTGLVRDTNLKPSMMFSSGDPSMDKRGRSIFIIHRPAITAKKLTPLAKKHQPSPMAATTIPATAGPMTRAPLNMDELSAMAFTRSARRQVHGIHNTRERGQGHYMPDLDAM